MGLCMGGWGGGGRGGEVISSKAYTLNTIFVRW